MSRQLLLQRGIVATLVVGSFLRVAYYQSHQLSTREMAVHQQQLVVGAATYTVDLINTTTVTSSDSTMSTSTRSSSTTHVASLSNAAEVKEELKKIQGTEEENQPAFSASKQNETMVLIQSKITSNINSTTNATELKQMKSITAKKLYASPPSFQNDWYNTSCHKPIPYPILGTHDLTRVINVGMPKCGSTSLTKIFTEAHEAFPGGTSHWGCGPGEKCGLCIKHAIEKGKAPLASCGNFDVFMQMDLADNTLDICVFPQIQYLDEIYNENPTATLILAFRNNVTKWVKSIDNWKSRAHGPFRDRIVNLCEFPNIGFAKSMGGTEEDMIGLACNHVKQVRHFVRDHPTLSLVEIDIDDPNTGNYLATLFPVNPKHWGNENKNPNSH